MVVVGIVGSPRRNMRTNMLVDAALEGVRSRDVKTEKVYIVDCKIRTFTGQGGSEEAFLYSPEDLSNLCEEADAIVLGAPVYWGDINGLTKDFMDTVRIRIPNANGKPALGISIAGGTGKGLLSGVQSIYHFFFHKQMRGIDPTPVSRFNLDEALMGLRKSGAILADLSKEKEPFKGETADDRWPSVLTYYSSLKYLNCDPLDEFMMLAAQLIKISKSDTVEKAKAEFDKATTLIAEGKRVEAARHAVESYQILYFPP
jgi:NAD(P)H-dependent FMN reductase